MSTNGKQKYAPNSYEIAKLLRSKYEDFAHNNRRNPLNELLFIVSSIKTTGLSYENTYNIFRKKFPTFESISQASRIKLTKALSTGGLQNVKAKAIIKITKSIKERLGKLTLSPLKKMSDRECELFLTSLYGVGKKVARCVMMYSLNRKVFPVDTHCWRISCRIGWVRPTSNKRICTPKDMDRLQAKIPPELRFSLHVNMISLGREICTYHNPQCDVCPVNSYCKKTCVFCEKTALSP